jgi:hypothetical protein
MNICAISWNKYIICDVNKLYGNCCGIPANVVSCQMLRMGGEGWWDVVHKFNSK